MTTALKKWFDLQAEGSLYPVYTCDSWTIPEEGTEIWCTGWPRGQTIKPYGDGCHIVVGLSVYHCDEFMSILDRRTAEGHKWGIVGVNMERSQRLGGYWKKVSV